MELFVSGEFDERQVGRLHHLDGIEVVHLHGFFDTDAPMEPAFLRSEVAFGNVPPSWLDDSPALRWLQLESVGFGEYTGLNWADLSKRVTLTNLADFFTEPVAESALAGILALYRGIDRLVQLQRAGDWQGDELRKGLRTLKGAKVVLFGYGAINQRLAALLDPFGCDIRPFGKNEDAASLDAALTRADVVVCCAPDTEATRGVFGAVRLGLLGDRTVFVNFGRGSLVDEDALADALSAGSLGGAVIDVTLDEPMPPGHKFWACPNMIVTQHSGGGTEDEIDRKIEVLAENLTHYRAGRPLVGTVNFSRGY